MTFEHLRGKTLRLGGIDNENGEFAIFDESGNQVGTWDTESLKLGSVTDFVQLYGPTSDPGQTGQTITVPLLVAQTYNNAAVRMMLYQAVLFLDNGTREIWVSPNSIQFRSAGGGVPDVSIGQQYFTVMGGNNYVFEFPDGGDLVIGADNLDVVGNYMAVGTPGVTGTFRSSDNKTVTVKNGIITSIA